MDGQHFKSQSAEELWSKLRNGKKEALRILFLRYYDSLYQYGMTICSSQALVEDCLQELFFQLWEKHDRLSEVQKVEGYLWVSFRRMLMRQLKQQNDDHDLFILLFPGARKTNSTEEKIITQEQKEANQEALNEIIDNLTQRERQVLFLKYYEGMSYSEIEEILGIRYQTARNYVYRALTHLREILDKEEMNITLLLLALPFLY